MLRSVLAASTLETAALRNGKGAARRSRTAPKGRPLEGASGHRHGVRPWQRRVRAGLTLATGPAAKHARRRQAKPEQRQAARGRYGGGGGGGGWREQTP